MYEDRVSKGCGVFSRCMKVFDRNFRYGWKNGDK